MITNRLHTLCIGLAVATAATSCTQAAPPATTPPAVAVAAEVAAPAATEAPMNGLVALPPAVAKYRVDVKQDCGARGDGKANDSAAFREAAVRLQKAGGGTLVIPKGTYIVGEQTHDAGQYPYYKMGLIFEVRSLKGLLIEGNGATLRLAPGLRYGSFDKDMGEPFTPPAMPFTDTKYAANAGAMVAILNSRNVTIRNLELDGNLQSLILGGPFNDTGRQLAAYGLLLYNNTDVHVQKVHTHHHGLDGLAIGWTGLKESDPATPHTLIDVVSEYNGRQGLSWVGGRGLRALRCKFNHTGRALNNGVPLVSAPAAGLDIEAEAAVARDGWFENCEFINNASAGMVADSGDGGYSKFKNCTFWGTTSWSTWVKKPGIKFENCNFYGSIVHAYPSPDPNLATAWIRCRFEDKPWKDGKVYRQNSDAYLLEIGNGEGVEFNDCQFTANTSRSMWFENRGTKLAAFTNCTWLHKKADLKDQGFQAVIRGAALSGCRFKERFPPGTMGHWSILTGGTTVLAGEPTVVDGPRVKWQSWSTGATGTLKPGLYN